MFQQMEFVVTIELAKGNIAGVPLLTLFFDSSHFRQAWCRVPLLLVIVLLGLRFFLYRSLTARTEGRQKVQCNPSPVLVCFQFCAVLWPFKKIHNPSFCRFTFCFCLLRFVQVFGQFFDVLGSPSAVVFDRPFAIGSLTSRSIYISQRTQLQRRSLYNNKYLAYVIMQLAGPSGRAVWGLGQRPLACWDCGFESRRGHVCLLWTLCVVR